jgi:hypothetical protein
MKIPCENCLILPLCKARIKVEKRDVNYSMNLVITELMDLCKPLKYSILNIRETRKARKKYGMRAMNIINHNKIKMVTKYLMDGEKE